MAGERKERKGDKDLGREGERRREKDVFESIFYVALVRKIVLIVIGNLNTISFSLVLFFAYFFSRKIKKNIIYLILIFLSHNY